MTSFECYQEYLALKNHFTKMNYDYFKYQGKIRTNPTSFNKRPDKIFFDKLSKNDNVHDFLLANFIKNDRIWIRDLAYDEEPQKIYKEWLKRQQSLSYTFQNDLNKLNKPLKNNLISNSNEHPILLKLFLGDQICLETLCIILKFTDYYDKWNSIMEYDIMWDSLKLKVLKYTPFIKYERSKFIDITLKHFQ